MLEEIFTKSVHQYFNPVAKRFGLRESSSDMDNVVSYENDKICLEVYYDSRRSYEMGVYITNKKTESKDKERNSFDLVLILELKALSETKAIGSFQTSNPKFIPEAVKILAYSTKTYAPEALQGEEKFFRELADLEEIKSQKYEDGQKLWYARRDAEKAWQNKDYSKIVKVYKQLEDHLTPAEKKKLQYAEKMVS